MKKKTSKWLSALLTVTMVGGMSLPMVAEAAPEAEDIVVLYTNDVHCTGDEGMSYAGISGYKAEMEAQYGADRVTLVDNGDAIQGAVLGTLSKGGWIVDIMNEVGYDIAVAGNHEFDFGMDVFLDIANNQADYIYTSCNFLDKNGKRVLKPYVMESYGDVDVAYVGISTPETISKSTPSFFQNDKGEYIYSFCQDGDGKALYQQVQKSVDAARAGGADYVVALSHLGEDAQSSPWMSTEVIANTSGIDAVLDGHSHTINPSKSVKNAKGEDVLLSQSGTKGNKIGKLVIEKDGDMRAELVDTASVASDSEAYKTTQAFIQDIQSKYQAVTQEVVGKSETTLTVNDPTTGKRAVRSRETNLGDFCADAYRAVMGADIGFINGGGIRADIKEGKVTYGDVIAVHPFGNTACLVEVKGSQILDALELGAMHVGTAESGGFLQVSGLTYRINPSVKSHVVLDHEGGFVKVNGERRVSDVKVWSKESGKYEAIDANKTYTLASHNYMLKNGGDGYTMFGPDNVKILKDEIMVDNEVLMTYLSDHLHGVIDKKYADPYGQGRITIAASYPDVLDSDWYSASVRYVTDAGLMSTTDGVHFNPRQEMSRASVYTVLYRIAGSPKVVVHPVKDTADKWYNDSINWAYNEGLMKDTAFGKDRALSRAETADIMEDFARLQGVQKPSGDGSMKQLKDYDAIPQQYLEDMTFCYYNKFMTGNEKGELLPNYALSRAEFAQVLRNYNEVISPYLID